MAHFTKFNLTKNSTTPPHISKPLSAVLSRSKSPTPPTNPRPSRKSGKPRLEARSEGFSTDTATHRRQTAHRRVRFSQTIEKIEQNNPPENPGIFEATRSEAVGADLRGRFRFRAQFHVTPYQSPGNRPLRAVQRHFRPTPQPQPKNSPTSGVPHPKGCDAEHNHQCNLRHSLSHARTLVYARVLLRGRTCIRAHARMYERTYARIMRASARGHARARTS